MIIIILLIWKSMISSLPSYLVFFFNTHYFKLLNKSLSLFYIINLPLDIKSQLLFPPPRCFPTTLVIDNYWQKAEMPRRAVESLGTPRRVENPIEHLVIVADHPSERRARLGIWVLQHPVFSLNRKTSRLSMLAQKSWQGALGFALVR